MPTLVVEVDNEFFYVALLGALLGGFASFIGAYLALRHRAHSAERARMATEIMYHLMTAIVILEESLVAVEEVLNRAVVAWAAVAWVVAEWVEAE